MAFIIWIKLIHQWEYLEVRTKWLFCALLQLQFSRSNLDLQVLLQLKSISIDFLDYLLSSWADLEKIREAIWKMLLNNFLLLLLLQKILRATCKWSNFHFHLCNCFWIFVLTPPAPLPPAPTQPFKFLPVLCLNVNNCMGKSDYSRRT